MQLGFADLQCVSCTGGSLTAPSTVFLLAMVIRSCSGKAPRPTTPTIFRLHAARGKSTTSASVAKLSRPCSPVHRPQSIPCSSPDFATSSQSKVGKMISPQGAHLHRYSPTYSLTAPLDAPWAGNVSFGRSFRRAISMRAAKMRLSLH